jgi:hypothetical protein
MAGIAVRRTASLPLAYVPGIHVLTPSRHAKTEMAGTSPAMTTREAYDEPVSEDSRLFYLLSGNRA